MPKQIRKRNKQKKRNSSGTDGNRAVPNQITRIPKSVDLLFPDRLRTRLSYNGVGTQTMPVGSSAIAFRYRPSSAWDVDPVLGSTSMPGFAELAGIYNNYRVISSTMRYEASSNDARMGTAVLLPLNTDPGSAPSGATIESWTMNPYKILKMVGANGAPPVRLVKHMSTEKIYGSKAVYFDDNFSSLTNANPANNWFWAVGIQAPIPVVTTAWTLTSLIVIMLEVEFFARKELLS